MRKPEDLIGLKSKSNHDNSYNNDNSGSGTSYTIRYSSADFLAEAVLIAGQPKFLVVDRNSGSISIKSSINMEGKILKPLKKEAYLSKAYSFLLEQEIYEYENESRNITLGELYLEIKSLCQLFIIGDNNHITLLGADITYTYYQDRLGLTHYLFFIGKPGSGKSNNLTLIKLLGYRTFMSTDMTPANIYQFLGSQEEATGTLCIDEANSIDENNRLMEIYKTGYVTGGKVARTDTHNGRVQNAYYTFCHKAFAGERLPDGVTANGFNERIIPINCYDGNPKYDIAEIVSPAGEQEYQQLLDRLEHTRNLLFIHRIIHRFKPIPIPKIQLKRREKQLFISLIRMYHGEDVWPEIKSAIRHYILERRGRQVDTLHAYLYGLIKSLVKDNNSTELQSSLIWRELKNELAGNEIPNKPLSYYTERFGLISASLSSSSNEVVQREPISETNGKDETKDNDGLPLVPGNQIGECKGSADCFRGIVTEIVDGDTIDVNNVRIRLSMVNTPERGEVGYNEATDFTESICPVGGNALVDEDDGQKEGSYDRLIGVVYCNGNTASVNQLLLEEGKAIVYEDFCDVSEFANDKWVTNFGC